MITEIVIGRTYKEYGYLRTVVFFDDNEVFYKYFDDKNYGYMSVDTFKSSHSEIQEAPKKWYQITYKKKFGMNCPYVLESLFLSSDDFFQTHTLVKEDLEFFNMTELPNQLGEL